MAITEYEDQIQEIVSRPDHSEFIYDFLSVYDIPRATVTKLRKRINNLAKEPGAVYLKNKLYFREGTSDLMQDFTDLQDRVDELGSKPRYLLVTNYEHLLAKDVKTNETLDIDFTKLPLHFDFFLAWNGIEKADFDKENPADVRAAERFAKLYDVVVKDNPNATRKGLNLFLIRILFCLFAEDTNIFKRDLFTNRVNEMTADDGSDFDQFISSLFGVLDFEKSQRPADTPSWLNDFPYVDGDLFKDPHEPLHFSAKSRKLIIEAGELLKWSQINPDIFGSMIQAVASEDSRSHLGMHYTSVPNIMKVIKPLFLDGLREDFEAAKGNENKLQQLYDRIGKIKFMDPACGSGNFLIITYKELRQLEIEIIKELNNIPNVQVYYIPSVTLDQFYGIEIDDFACDVTRLSLWIAEHQMNVKLHEQISDAVRPTLPLQHAGAIVRGNALLKDWNLILKHSRSDDVYVFGNPPYLGARKQDESQKKDLATALNSAKGMNSLDYISGWFFKASEFIKDSRAKYSFVTTNSITQGEQVAVLWPLLFALNSTIIFAYNSFRWKNNAKNNAGVIVAIVGVGDYRYVEDSKLLINGNLVRPVENISPYLSDGDDTVVSKSKVNLFGLPEMTFGSMPNDGGNFIISNEAYSKISDTQKRFFKKYVGSNEFMQNQTRYCLWLANIESNQYNGVAEITSRISKVKSYRLQSRRAATRKLADNPSMFGEIRWKNTNAIIIPEVSSGNRLYVPMGIVDSSYVISNKAMAIYDAELWILGLLESRMHMVWLNSIGGKLKMDYNYSITLVYNTFPVPKISTRRKKEIESLVLDILDIREEEDGTLATQYGSPLAETHPKPMNEKLLTAHQKLDVVVDHAYQSSGFENDADRFKMLLSMYKERIKVTNE
ncbi:class I SAM-dependent DNA methyltransferase [Lacticaseibacillus porcinae]|uniref:class I SAM-dependent DNA methyltransferase n=1 Tax=Lacticaseibacillus porcinae TaxID=1123687 RepID=UPI000F7880BA|nr:DNA methyltransferase [Lacticaseibacillus porcinae]